MGKGYKKGRSVGVLHVNIAIWAAGILSA